MLALRMVPLLAALLVQSTRAEDRCTAMLVGAKVSLYILEFALVVSIES
jgi:hypothetical protein